MLTRCAVNYSKTTEWQGCRKYCFISVQTQNINLHTLKGRVITKNQRQKMCCLYLEALLLYLFLEYLKALGEIGEVLIHGLN